MSWEREPPFIFRILFKIDQNIHQQDEMEPQEYPQERMLRGMKILLAEDNEINMEIAEFYLTELGAEVDKAWNGKEAVEKFAESEPGRYDAILMDVMMPVMDGITAAKHIRKLKREDAGKRSDPCDNSPGFRRKCRKCLDAGMDGYIPKPIDARKLGDDASEDFMNKMRKNMNRTIIDTRVIKIRTFLVFCTAFLIAMGCIFLVNKDQEKREKLKAALCRGDDSQQGGSTAE